MNKVIVKKSILPGKPGNSYKTVILTYTLTVSLFLLSSFTNDSRQCDDEPEKGITLTFVNHIAAGLIEQDVFVEKVPGSGEVYRLLPAEIDQYLDAKIYSIREPLHHDPFDREKVGPYAKGRDLGMTLGEWLNASGTANFTCDEGWGTLKATFDNLLPNSTYTVWHFFMPAPPTVPFTGTLDIPLGDREGTQSVFTTDENGQAFLDVTFERCLQLSGDQLMSGMAIALHSDGQTYGPEPGAFGKVTHVHLFAMLPDMDDERYK